LSNPPIREAIVEIRRKVDGPFTQDQLKDLWPQIKDRYPHLEARNALKTKFRSAGEGQPPTAETTDVGFHSLYLKRADGSFISQFRADAVTVSQMRGYTTAVTLFDEVLDLWTRYAALVGAPAVTRVAVRYINSLSLPFVHDDQFERFLTTPPTLPADAPQSIAEFQVRMVLPNVAPDTSAVVLQRLGPGDRGVDFMLDLDVFKTAELATTVPVLRSELEQLRGMKNRLFFSFLTDEALAPYR
jgi:uncharacterized protein (TIGR04255 family)